MKFFKNKFLFALYILELCLFETSHAQTFNSNGLDIFISPGTIVTNVGDWQNDGTISNNGSLAISGNWTNSGLYNGDGALEFNGTSNQTIIQGADSIHQMILSGGGEKLVQTDLYINGDLMLTHGILTPENSWKILMGPNSTIIGGSDSSFVNGYLFNSGTGNKYYPIGINGQYLPVTLLNIKGFDPVVGYRVSVPAGNLITTPGIEAVSSQRYWEKSVLSGIFIGSRVALNIVNENIITNFSRVVVSETQNLDSGFISLGRASISGDSIFGQITSNTPATSNYLAMAQSYTPANVEDSLALVDVYVKTNGNSWTRKANWLSGNVNTWEGITTSNGRITDINLNNNNLTGHIPFSLKNLNYLKNFDISQNHVKGDIPSDILVLDSVLSINIAGNYFTKIPDFTWLLNLQDLTISNNQLGFEYIEPNRNVAGIVYNPQDSLEVNRNDTIDVGSSYHFTSGTYSPANSYQWNFNSTEITGGNDSTFSIAAISRDSIGDYSATITNSIITDLTMYTKPARLLAKATVSGTVKDSNGNSVESGEMKIFRITASGAFDTTNIASITSGGLYTIPDVLLDDYVLVADADDNNYPDLIPTYYGNTIYWEEADTIPLVDNISQVDIGFEVEPLPTTGSGSILGTVEEDLLTGGRSEARRAVARATVSVSRTSGGQRMDSKQEGELISVTTTNENGQFTMQNLDPGFYIINVQYPGIPMDKSSDVNVQVGNESYNRNADVLATVLQNGIVVQQLNTTGLPEGILSGIKIFPNPTSDFLIIETSGNVEGQRWLSIVDEMGREIYGSPLEMNRRVKIDVSNYNNGTYILRIINDNEMKGYEAARVIIFK